MSDIVFVCAMFAASAAPVPPVPVNQAPAPRLVKPDISLAYLEWLPGAVSQGESNRSRLWIVGFRNGRMLPPEVVWEADDESLDISAQWHGRYHFVAGRYLISGLGTVIDLREKKVINSERESDIVRAEETRVVYLKGGDKPAGGLFAFEYATGTVTRLGDEPPKQWYQQLSSIYKVSPDRKKAITWDDKEELILHRESQKPKSLGKDFKMVEDPKGVLSRSLQYMYFPALWLDSETILTQRGHGNLVVVNLAGKITEVANIKNPPKFATPRFERDIDGAIYSHLDAEVYHVDLVRKTAVKSEWRSLGHGFEASWAWQDKLGYKLRYKGKDIGQLRCRPELSQTAPGYLALAVDQRADERMFYAKRQVAVWSAATEQWAAENYEYLSIIPLVGWIK